jgi:hypothetical protein
VYAEELAGRASGVVARYVLNCRPLEALASGGRALFEMELTLPAKTRPGRYSLLWLLGPTTYAPPKATARVVVTR